tara:strand:- start:13273 stop:13857 length:585 start_codon:yes stop_codon:yes gene_type:complete
MREKRDDMKKENNQKWIGPLGEILALVGTLCFATFDGWQSVSGLIVAIAVVIAAIIRHEPHQYLASAIRKALSLTPGVLVHFGLIHPEKAVSLVGLIAPSFAIYWSWKANGGGEVPSRLPCILAMVCSIALFLPSCASPPIVFDLNSNPSGDELRDPITGAVIRQLPGGGAKAVIDAETVGKWFLWGQRNFSSE